MDHRITRATGSLVVVAMLALVAPPVAVGTTPSRGLIDASDHTCALTTRGGVTCWGDDSTGGLGDGRAASSRTPVVVLGLESGVTAIAAGDRYTCALTGGGGVKCWGYNEFGQLGDGTTTDRRGPVDVVGLATGVRAIGARGEHTCALTGRGVSCWGWNKNGQLGDGTTTSSSVPVDVADLPGGIRAIAVGGEHTCAVTSEGGAVCWGWNAAGQLGIGTTTDAAAPVAVPGITGVSAIAAGGRHTCALLIAGAAKCWGYGEYGQLGAGTTADSTVPVDVAGLGRFDTISAGGNFTCALATDHGVQCWGLNASGQLGDRTTIDRMAPVDVMGLSGALTDIAAGYYHICGITRDSRVTCWGGNDAGQLGNGTTIDSATPVNVSHADGSMLIAAGGSDDKLSGVQLISIAILIGVVLVAIGRGYVSARRRGG